MRYKPTYENKISTRSRLAIGAAAGLSIFYTGIESEPALRITAETLTTLGPLSTLKALGQAAFEKEIMVPRAVDRFIDSRAGDAQYYSWLTKDTVAKQTAALRDKFRERQKNGMGGSTIRWSPHRPAFMIRR